jgi:hypothetical protein
VTAPHEQAAPPLDYLTVASLGELTTAELASRRANLLYALCATPPGGADGALAAVLALAAVIAEQDQRARAYASHQGIRYRCTCGHQCLGLDAMDSHLDESPRDSSHDEAWREDAGGNRRALIAACSASSADARNPRTRPGPGPADTAP